MTMERGGPKVLAVASGGGHWEQLLRLRPALSDARLCFVSVKPGYAADVPGERFRMINDATRWDKLGLVRMAIRLAVIFALERPDVVISTGAAPGYFALRLAKLMGAKTAWIDSIANVDELSMTGTKVKPYADLWLTQWEHLAGGNGPRYVGAVL